MTAATIIAELPNLNAADLQKVRASVGFLSTDHSPTPNELTDQLFEAMRAELHYQPNFSQFRKSKRYPAWASHLPALVAFLDEHFRFQELHTTAQRALLRLLVHLLLVDLKGTGAPLSIGVLAVNIGRLPEVFDAAFPGYTDGGLAYLIPKHMRRSR